MLEALKGKEETSPLCYHISQPQHSTASMGAEHVLLPLGKQSLQMVPCPQGVQARWQVLVKQNGQVGSF